MPPRQGRGRLGLKPLLVSACAVLLCVAAWRVFGPTVAQAGADAQPVAASGARAGSDTVSRGAYLAHAADCQACHLGAGGALSGGRAFHTPFGTIYASNITPDRETGIGGYSDEDWVSALRRGVGRGGKHLYPAMPYTNYTLMTREDALAIKAYIMAQPAAKAASPANDMRFPFNIRFLMVFWNMLNNPDHGFVADTAHDAAWNRGAYLAEALGHCQQCHTPRNIIQGLKSSQAYAGAVQQGWLANNVTSAASGIGGWKTADLASYLSTGRADGHGVAAGPMAEAVSYSTRYLTPEDSASLAAYLKTMPAHEAQAQAPASAPPSAAHIEEDALGRKIFEGACASCHRADGAGVQSPYATLLGDSAVSDPAGLNVLSMLREGGVLETPQGRQAMPSFAGGYSDAELAAVANYTIGTLGHVRGKVGYGAKAGS